MEGKAETDTEEFLDTVTKPPAAEIKHTNVLDPETELLDNSLG